MKETTLNRALKRYENTPHLVFWETTKACSLACEHCRASAQLDALPGELSTQEGFDLIDQIADMPGPSPILVFTGGDCLERDDLVELITYARSKGLRLGVAPSVTDRLTRATMQELYDLGVRSVSISLDGATSESHDTLRGIAGHFDKTIEALHMMRDIGFRLQVNTTVMKSNARELADVFALLRTTGVTIWEVFFLVGVGRGTAIVEVDPDEAEDISHFLVDVTTYGMTVRTVEAPFFRRVQVQREPFGLDEARDHFELGALYEHLRGRLELDGAVHDHPVRSTTLATGDGRGIVFVGFDGAVHASGFLPSVLGNVRDEPLAQIYAESLLLSVIRGGFYLGECGRCDFSRLCGGSRARAYAHTGMVLADDPACINTHRLQLPLGPAEVLDGAVN